MMRYEPATNKNCLGYWVNPADWADWTFPVDRPGTFDVEVWQGAGTGQGGSDVWWKPQAKNCPSWCRKPVTSKTSFRATSDW